MKFTPSFTDKALSPYTGLTRESWIEAGIYILKGVFENIKDADSPVVLPRKETEISYPHLNDKPENLKQQQLAEIFEGLTRTFFIAAPIIREKPDLTINGICLKDYYKDHILRVVDPKNPLFVGSYDSLSKLVKSNDPTRCYQQTVETCALVIGLWLADKEIWNTYSEAEKGLIADFLSGFANAATVPQNWRLFNMLDLAFLHMNGYSIDKSVMLDHAQAILSYYVGEGWYRDGQCFDYYSCWAFNVYAPIWNLWYGYENCPYIARQFEKHSNTLMETYPNFFDKDGFTNMWGRSNIYRNASTSAFCGNMLLKKSTANPGLARRIASGSLMQFLSREDVFFNGVPTLGFYGQFAPLVQGYSCAESPYWFGKAFLCLYLPKEHPFWSATEENGVWGALGLNGVKVTTLDGPALAFSNHGGNGETILRTGKIRKAKDDLHGMWNYGKLCYNTKYPWESTPLLSEGELKTGDVESEQYTIKDVTTGKVLHPNVMFWGREKDSVLYRRIFFDFDMETENHWNQAINLADFTVPLGIMRVDKLRLYRRPVIITLGSYGFPDNGSTEIVEKYKGNAKAIILKGTDSLGHRKQLAMTVYDGFDDLKVTKSHGTNPDSENSVVIYATAKRNKMYDATEPYVMISQVITLDNDREFTDAELFPIHDIIYEDEYRNGAYGTVTLRLKNGEDRVINYNKIERYMSL
ncbi:MAG: DUF2264 domain-containing protein [Lachnospiraceae bacterium]|nr:DUF2264 domain-containing protein [Lachnospiraceae bacterium]